MNQQICIICYKNCKHIYVLSNQSDAACANFAAIRISVAVPEQFPTEQLNLPKCCPSDACFVRSKVNSLAVFSILSNNRRDISDQLLTNFTVVLLAGPFVI